MLEATIRLADSERLIKVSGETAKDLFAEIAMAYELFNESECGLCHSKNIHPAHRVADKFHFYEYHCRDCKARLSLGQQDGGALFPVRKLLPNGKPSWKDGDYGEHKGWTHYKGEDTPAGPVASTSNKAKPGPQASPFVMELSRFVSQVKKQTGAEEHRDVDKVLAFSLRRPLFQVEAIHNEQQLKEVIDAYTPLQDRFREGMLRAAVLWDFLCAGGLDPKDGQSASVVCQWISSDLANNFTKTVADPKLYELVMKHLSQWYVGQGPAERKKMLQHANDWLKTQTKNTQQDF